MHDVHRIHTPNTAAGRIKGALFDEVPYADDTICISQSEEEIERALKAIRKEGSKYGMKLNRAKCEILSFGQVRAIQFEEGDYMNFKSKVKYLGVNLNDEANPLREIQERVTDCLLTLK